METYEKNLQSLKEVDEHLYEKLKEIESNNRFEVYVGNNYYENANILDLIDGSVMYEKEPIDDIQDKYKSIEGDKNLYKSLFLYGIGNGYLLKLLLMNSEHNNIYIFEPELELLYIALNLQDYSKDIKENRVIFIHCKEFKHSDFRDKITSETTLHFKTYDLIINTDFYEKFKSNIKKVNNETITLFRYLIQVTGNSAEDELIGFDHLLKNIPLMVKNATLDELKRKGANSDTVVLVATGPSLNKQLPLLKEIKDYVTIFSVDASLPILEKEQIKPDVVFSIERVAATGEFYKKCSKEFQEDIVFAISAVADENVLKNIKAGTLQISMRPVGNHYKALGIDEWGYLGFGLSAANMAYELTGDMDFKRVIIIGQDLAYGEDGKSHAKNHIFGENEVKKGKNDEYVTAYGGVGEVLTNKVWKMFLVGYEAEVAKNNQIGKMETINATEGGARINGTIEMSFKEAIDKFVNKERKKSKIILKKPTNEEFIKRLKEVKLKLEDAKEMGKNFIKKCKKLENNIEKMILKYKKYEIDKIDQYVKPKELKKIANEIADVRDRYYMQGIWDFYGSMISPLLTHLEYDIAYWSVQPEKSNRQKIQKRWKLMLFHYEWCTRIIVNLNAILKVLDENLPFIEKYIAV